jgi:hypothetical protein
MQHLWVANISESVPPGIAACIEGPFSSPSGATIFYDITDVQNDDMDVSVVADGEACDGSAGYALTSSTDWTGRQSAKTGALPGGHYNLAVTCYNPLVYCAAYLSSFGYQD